MAVFACNRQFFVTHGLLTDLIDATLNRLFRGIDSAWIVSDPLGQLFDCADIIVQCGIGIDMVQIFANIFDQSRNGGCNVRAEQCAKDAPMRVDGVQQAIQIVRIKILSEHAMDCLFYRSGERFGLIALVVRSGEKALKEVG